MLNMQWPEGDIYSVSQIKRFLECPRAWFFEKILKFKEDKDEQQDWGDLAHAKLAFDLGSKQEVDFPFLPAHPRVEQARANLAGLRVQPDDIERPFMLYLGPGQLGTPRWLVGVADWIDRIPGSYLGHAYELALGDHKTTRDMQWALGADDLATDLQLLTYAYAFGLERTTPPTAVKVSHHTIQREGRVQSRLVSTVVPWSVITAAWNKTLRVLDLMDRCRAAQTAGQVQKNIFACKKYGGCPQGERCALATLDKTAFAKPHTEGDTMTLNRTPIAQNPATAPQPVNALLARLRAGGQAAAPSGANTAPVQTTIAPPAPSPAPVVPPPAQEAPKPKRGRPRKVVEQAPPPALTDDEPEVQDQIDPEFTTPAPVPNTTPAPLAQREHTLAVRGGEKASAAKPISVLYIDCLPVGRSVQQRAETVLSKLEADFEAQAGFPWQFAQYREGVGAVLAALRAETFADEVSISSGGALANEAITVLSGLAVTVIRGVR